MVTLQDLRVRAESLKKQDYEMNARKQEIEKRINSFESESQRFKDDICTNNLAIQLLVNTSNISRTNAKKHFESIVTNALQFITQNPDYEFIIEEKQNKNSTSYEFYISSTVNGVKCYQKPEEANGGGFIDIISVAMKYAYLQIFNDPKIMNATLFYDEPGKMISTDMSIKFAEYIKFLGSHYGNQTIMVTHNENLANIADKTFIVQKNNNGISDTTPITSENIDVHSFINALQGESI